MATSASSGEIGLGGGANTFVPSFSPATGQIQVEFTRSPNRFAITRYAQLVPVQQMAGYFLRIDEEETVRIVGNADFVWPLGEDRPTGINNDFEFWKFVTQRFQTSFSLPDETAKQASWDVVASHARIAAARMMTLRTKRAADMLSTAGNYAATYTSFNAANGAGHYSTSTALINGVATAASGTYADGIQVLFRTAIEKIVLATAGVVGPNDIVAVMNPATARKIAATDGVRDYIKNTPHALNFLTGDQTFATYGLPSTLFGIGGLVVDDSVYVSTRKSATTAGTKKFFFGDTTPAIAFVSRPGGMVANEGPSFSTVSIFAYEDMTVETMADPWNRRLRGSVVDNSAIEMTAPLAAVYCADISS
jgi:hypothetical protein